MKESNSKIITFIHVLFIIVIYLDHESIITDEAWAKIFIFYFIIFHVRSFITLLMKKKLKV